MTNPRLYSLCCGAVPQGNQESMNHTASGYWTGFCSACGQHTCFMVRVAPESLSLYSPQEARETQLASIERLRWIGGLLQDVGWLLIFTGLTLLVVWLCWHYGTPGLGRGEPKTSQGALEGRSQETISGGSHRENVP